LEAIQAAKDQSRFREVNERLWSMNSHFEALGEVEFLCECARRDCMEHVSMSLKAYEALRRVPTHFAVAPDMGHVFTEVERVFARREGYFVVEKFGEAGVMATRLDPTRRSLPVDSLWQSGLGECIGSGVFPMRRTEQFGEDGQTTTGVCAGCLERMALDSNGVIPGHPPPGSTPAKRIVEGGSSANELE
jgi:hypothetical protein